MRLKTKNAIIENLKRINREDFTEYDIRGIHINTLKRYIPIQEFFIEKLEEIPLDDYLLEYFKYGGGSYSGYDEDIKRLEIKDNKLYGVYNKQTLHYKILVNDELIETLLNLYKVIE